MHQQQAKRTKFESISFSISPTKPQQQNTKSPPIKPPRAVFKFSHSYHPRQTLKNFIPITNKFLSLKKSTKFTRTHYIILSPIPQPRNPKSTFLFYDKPTIKQTEWRNLEIVVPKPNTDIKHTAQHKKKTTIFSKTTTQHTCFLLTVITANKIIQEKNKRVSPWERARGETFRPSKILYQQNPQGTNS